MTNQDGNDRSPAAPGRRFPGRYIVYGIIAMTVLVMVVSLILALTLTPAAERFHNPPPPTRPQ